MTTYFGEPWDAPLFDDGGAVQLPTPVGRPCLTCGEPVVEGDRGEIMPHLRVEGGRPVATVEPIHAECGLLDAVGHEYGICHCTGYDTSARSSALALLAVLDEQRAWAGMAPLLGPPEAVP